MRLLRVASKVVLCLGVVAASTGRASNANFTISVRNAPDDAEKTAPLRAAIEGPVNGPTWSPYTPVMVAGGLSQTTTVVGDDGTTLFVIGGALGIGIARVSDLQAYDTTSDTWSKRSPVPLPNGISAFGSAVQYGGLIYVFGGVTGESTILQTTWIYDIVNDVWFAGADLPGPRFGCAVAGLNGKIIVAGGASTIVETTTWQYDPSSDSFSDLGAPMPDDLPTYRIHGVGLDAWGDAGQLHVFAGHFDGTGHYVYDAAANRWSFAAPMPFGVTDPGVATDGSRIFVTGGPIPQPMPLPGRLQIFDLASETWSQGAIMSGPVNNTSAAIGRGIIFNVGGYDGLTSIPDMLGTPVPPPGLGGRPSGDVRRDRSVGAAFPASCGPGAYLNDCGIRK
jgi:hypothetical protein